MTPPITVTGYCMGVDLLMSKLDEAMQEHMAFIVFHEKRPFSYKDFLKFEVDGKIYGMKHGTFRNKMTKLRKKGEVERLCCSPQAFYTLKGHKFGKPMTSNHMGVSPNNTLDRIYTNEEIEKAKKSPSFEREYNLKYLGLIGNVFHTQDIENSICEYNPDDWQINSYSRASMGIDCGFGSSAFGIVVTRLVNNKIQIVFADEFERPDYNEMLIKVWDLDKNYHVNNIYVDGANPEFIRSLKSKIGELFDPAYYNQYIELYRKNNSNIENCMKVIPVHFAREHADALQDVP